MHQNAEMVTVMAPLVSGGSVVPTIIAYLLELAEREGFD